MFSKKQNRALMFIICGCKFLIFYKLEVTVSFIGKTIP